MDTLILNDASKVTVHKELTKSIGEVKTELGLLYQTSDLLAICNGSILHDGMPQTSRKITFCPRRFLKELSAEITLSDEQTQKRIFINLSQCILSLKTLYSSETYTNSMYIDIWHNNTELSDRMMLIELDSYDLSVKKVNLAEAFRRFFQYVLRTTDDCLINELPEFIFLRESSKENHILGQLLWRVGMLTCKELGIIPLLADIFTFKSLLGSNENLRPEELNFKESLFDCVARPCDFPKILELGGIKDKEKVIHQIQQYMREVTSMLLIIYGERLGELKQISLSSEMVSLAKSILLARPSLHAMETIHGLSQEKLREKVESILGDWEAGRNVYCVEESTRVVFSFLSCAGGMLIVNPVTKGFSLFELAYGLCHEIQHIIMRLQGMVYSPLSYPSHSEVWNIFNRLNGGVPIEAGHLYWSMMTNFVCPTGKSIETILGPQCLNDTYWLSLEEQTPFVDFSLCTVEKCYMCELPFSFDISYTKPRGFIVICSPFSLDIE